MCQCVRSSKQKHSQMGPWSTHNPPVVPPDAVTRNPRWLSAGGFLVFLRLMRHVLLPLFFRRLGSWDVWELCASGPGTSRDHHGFFVNQTDQGSSCHAAHEHAAVDEVICSQALEDLHAGDADDEAYAVADVWCRKA